MTTNEPEPNEPPEDEHPQPEGERVEPPRPGELRDQIERALRAELRRVTDEIGRRLVITLAAYSEDEIAGFVRTLGGNDPDAYARRVARMGLAGLHDRADEIAGKSDYELRAEDELYRVERLAEDELGE